MTPAISADLKHRIVQLYSTGDWTMEEVAEQLTVSIGLVSKVINIYHNYGTVIDPTKQRTGRPPYADGDDHRFLHQILAANPNLYLDKIQDRLAKVRNLHVSIATISCMIRDLGMSWKGVTKAALERNEELRMLWRLDMAEYEDPELFVFLDESAVDNHTTQRMHGWSETGAPCINRGTFLRGTRFSLLPTLSVDGIIALDIFKGSVNKERFITFLREHVAPKLNPFPGKHSIVVIDNCAIHHDEDIWYIVEVECGAKLIYLPPYSPDFNPIKEAFLSIKAWLRRNEGWYTNLDQLPWLIEHATASVTTENARMWFKDCGYIFD